MEPTYENIKPLIIEEIWTDQTVNFKLQAANQKEPIATMGMAMVDPEVMNKRLAAETAKMMAAGAATGMAANALGTATGVGGGIINSAASMAGVGYQIDMAAVMKVDMTDEVKKKLVVDTFKHMMIYYVWENGAWVYVEPKA
jgi:hypothetical protein